MSRQAVHKERMFAGLRHQLVVDLIRTENFNSFKEFVLLPHAGPYIGIDRVRAPHISRLRRPVDTFSRRRTVVLRANRSEAEINQRTRLKQGPRYVVPASDVD